MKAAVTREERTVRRAHVSEREPQDPMAGTGVPAEPSPVDTVPVRHLAHRMLEALS